jgi:hypothetical protein
MRTRRILVVALAVLAAGVAAAAPAHAGNWEETLLDPPPARVEAGVTYTFGYWILQHGSYPFQDGSLGPTALLAADEKGNTVDFPGTESKTAGHYSAEVVFPHDGVWRLSSKHGVLMPDEDVATVTVPGGVEISPSMMVDRAHHDWGAVRPSFPVSAPDARIGVTAPDTGQTALVEPRGQVTADEPAGTALPGWLVAVGGVAVIGFALLLVHRYRSDARSARRLNRVSR